MAMQSDIKTTKPLTATGVFKTQADADCASRARIKAIYATCGAVAGSVVIRDGATGPILITVNTPTVADAGTVYIIMPDQGILAQDGLHGTVTNTASITVFYG